MGPREAMNSQQSPDHPLWEGGGQQDWGREDLHLQYMLSPAQQPTCKPKIQKQKYKEFHRLYPCQLSQNHRARVMLTHSWREMIVWGIKGSGRNEMIRPWRSTSPSQTLGLQLTPLWPRCSSYGAYKGLSKSLLLKLLRRPVCHPPNQ